MSLYDSVSSVVLVHCIIRVHIQCCKSIINYHKYLYTLASLFGYLVNFQNSKINQCLCACMVTKLSN